MLQFDYAFIKTSQRKRSTHMNMLTGHKTYSKRVNLRAGTLISRLQKNVVYGVES